MTEKEKTETKSFDEMDYKELIEIKFKDTEITSGQLKWVMCSLAHWLKKTNGGSLLTLARHLNVDHEYLNLALGLTFTNAVFDAIEVGKRKTIRKHILKGIVKYLDEEE